LLWQGGATASSSENRNSNQGGLAGLLVNALVNQIVETASDTSFKCAAIASQRLLSHRANGVLYGPRSPNYQKD
jgi:hypothetical protein